jgi:hypothetical protein
MRHTVSIGDEIMIGEQLFIVTGVRVERDKPSVLITKQPVELLVKSVQKDEEPPEMLDGCCVNQVSNLTISPTRCVRCGQHLIVRNRQWVRYQPKGANNETITD